MRAGADYVTFTCTPGNDYLMAMADIKSNTLGRFKRWLKRHGFLGMVANGRCAIYTPKSSDGFSNLYPHGKAPEGRMADRAVFVLCVPMSDGEIEEYAEHEVKCMDNRGKLGEFFMRLARAVEVNRNPLPNSAKRNPKSKKELASPTLIEYFEAAARETAKLEAARTDLSWPRTKTTEAPDEATRSFNELQAARTVQWYAPALQKLPSRYLARILAPFFRAGWNARDVLHAFDHKPNGAPHRNDGWDGAHNLPALVQHRLNYWRMNGQPTYGLTQRQQKRSDDARARAMAVKPQARNEVRSTENFRAGIALLREALKPKSS